MIEICFFTAKHQKVCVPCPDHCTSCPESPHTCALCEDNYEILESGAVCSPHCSSNHFRNSLLQWVLLTENPSPSVFYERFFCRCKSCDVSCDTCVGPSSKDCLRCASGFVRQRDECRHNCSFGFFLGPDSKECLMWVPPCSSFLFQNVPLISKWMGPKKLGSILSLASVLIC